MPIDTSGHDRATWTGEGLRLVWLGPAANVRGQVCECAGGATCCSCLHPAMSIPCEEQNRADSFLLAPHIRARPAGQLVNPLQERLYHVSRCVINGRVALDSRFSAASVVFIRSQAIRARTLNAKFELWRGHCSCMNRKKTTKSFEHLRARTSSCVSFSSLAKANGNRKACQECRNMSAVTKGAIEEQVKKRDCAVCRVSALPSLELVFLSACVEICLLRWEGAELGDRG